MEIKKLNAIHPGTIKSLDGDLHYISFGMLIKLYHLDPKTCIHWDLDRPESYMGRRWEDYNHFFPQENGNYPLDKK